MITGSTTKINQSPMATGTISSGIALDQKRLIDEALLPVAGELEGLGPELLRLLECNTVSGNHILNHVLAGGGKRIRPALYFFASRMVGYGGAHLIPMAAVCEYVHTASLLHDDVIDSSAIRRGKPTPNSIWGDEAAVLVGDLIYARASELMAETGSLQIVSMFARAIRLMSDGELLQLEHLYNPVMSEEVYLKIIEQKTAVLLAAACKAPAVLAGVSLADCEALSEFGRCLGFAFQLLDDALDYAGTESVFGKKTLSDLPEGKITLPIILLKSLATPAEWGFVEGLIHEERVSEASMSRVLALVETYDTAGKTLEAASNWTDRALVALAHFPNNSARHDLENLANRLLVRFS